LGSEGIIEVKTSGSTGIPKRILLTREQMRQSALATGEYFDLAEDAKALLCLPLKYIAGKMMLVRAMTLGWQLYGTDPAVRLELPGTGVFDFAAMVPMQLKSNLDKLDRIRNLIVGGAPVHPQLQQDIEKLHTRIFETYGMTETVTHIALKPLNRSAGKKNENEAFRGLPGVLFETDPRGCLVIEAGHLSPKAIVTNDLVELVSKTSFIWKGRIDGVINSGGMKLIPEEVEQKFSACIRGRFFAAGLPDPNLGQRLVFVVEGQENPNLLDQLIRFQKNAEGSVMKQEIPKKLIFVPAFIETPSKKIDRIKTLELAKVIKG
jgi:O-succinylbenzoic acid--CoA ligase